MPEITKEDVRGVVKEEIQPIIEHLAKLNGAVASNTTWRVRAQGFIAAVVVFALVVSSTGIVEHLWQK